MPNDDNHGNSKQDEIPLIERLKAYQHIIRRWAGHLKASEFMVAMTILDRSVGWGNKEVRISRSQFLHRNEMYSGLNMSKSTLKRALKRLKDIGLIEVVEEGYGRKTTVYRMNYQLEPKDD